MHLELRSPTFRENCVYKVRRPFRVMRRVEGSLSSTTHFRKLQGRGLPLPYPSPPVSDSVAHDSVELLTVLRHGIPMEGHSTNLFFFF